MRNIVRLEAFAEYARGSLWVLPSVSVLLAIVVGGVLSQVQIADDRYLSALLFPGGPEGARGMLQAIAGSVITVASLVFSLTVVTLQLASSQFSPRLLRTFLRRPANQVVMSVFMATFVYSLVVLRSIRAEEGARFVPALAVTIAFILVLCSVAALVFFIHHITSEIRADTLMERVEHDALATLDHVHADPIDVGEQRPTMPEVPTHAVPVPSLAAGIVQAIAVESLADAARDHDVSIVITVRVGERVVRDGTLAWTWRRKPGDAAPDIERLAADVNGALNVGHERTMQQDVSFGLRQLVDMAAKALSTGVNDPTTAVDAAGHLASLLSVLARRRMVDVVVTDDDDDVVRVYVPQRSFEEYLETACGQIRRYGSNEPEVAIALLDLLREVGSACMLDEHRSAVDGQLTLVVEAARDNIAQEADRERVMAMAELVRQALKGRRFLRMRADRDDIATSV